MDNIEREINIDKLKLISESSLFLSEEVKNKIDNVEEKEKISKDKSDLRNKAKSINSKLNKIKNNMSRSDDELIHGYSSFSGIMRLIVRKSPYLLITLANPLLGIITFMGQKAIHNKMDKARLVKLYSDEKANLQVIDEQLERLNKLQKLSSNQQKEKENLIHMRSKVNDNLKLMHERYDLITKEQNHGHKEITIRTQ